MNELQVENMNAVEMTVGEIANIPLANDSTTRIINAVSPTATVVKDGTTATITITDKNGTTTATISDGETGATGPAAYVHIRYAEDEPTQDSDMKTEPDAWMGVYSGSSETAPTHYTDYRWGKIQGEQGEQGEPGEGVPAGGAAGLFLKKSSSTDYDTEWDSVPDPQTMTGATSSAAGTGGLVPAPSAGANVYFLRGDATWAIPAGGKLIVKDLDTVTNTSGSYTHSTSLSDVTSEMKAVMIELGNPSAFRDAISITTANGSITLSCNSVAGTSTVKVSLMFVAGADAITSSEFDVLAGRIGNLSSLTTTAKTSTVAAINELDSDIGTLNSKLTIISSGSLHDIKTCGAYYLTNVVTDKPTSTGGSYVVGSNGNVVSGIFTQNSTGNTYAVRFDGSTWTYEQLALNSNVLPQLFFGNGKGKYYGMTSKASIDAAVNDTVSPTNDNDGFFTIDNAYSITNFGNRQFLFGWLNSGKNYGWVIICSFGHVAIGTRNGSTSFTIIDISAINSKLSWTYINQLQTVNDSLQFQSDAREILFVQYNSGGGTAFASLCIPNSSMPSAFAVYSDVGHAVISRSSTTLTLTDNTNSSIIRVYYR